MPTSHHPAGHLAACRGHAQHPEAAAHAARLKPFQALSMALLQAPYKRQCTTAKVNNFFLRWSVDVISDDGNEKEADLFHVGDRPSSRARCVRNLGEYEL